MLPVAFISLNIGAKLHEKKTFFVTRTIARDCGGRADAVY